MKKLIEYLDCNMEWKIARVSLSWKNGYMNHTYLESPPKKCMVQKKKIRQRWVLQTSIKNAEKQVCTEEMNKRIHDRNY